jgi:hypothetical protein
MIDGVMSSRAAFVALATISYALAFALSFAMEIIVRFGSAGLWSACVAWTLIVTVIAVWHFRRLLWIAPQLLVLVGFLDFLEEQSHCPPPLEWCVA